MPVIALPRTTLIPKRSMEQFYTAGALRILEAALRLAQLTKSPEVRGTHLLWALATQESRAGEILAEHRLTRETLATETVMAEVVRADPDVVSENTTQPPANTSTDVILPDVNRIVLDRSGAALREIVFEAGRQVGLAGRHAEVGSEHLLYGLAVVESNVQTLLHQQGLTGDRLAPLVSEQTGFSSEPLEIDFSLAWSEQSQSDLTDTYRTLDAAANRGREGLRVVEDFLRFHLDDAHLTARLKSFRHKLTSVLKQLDPDALLAARATESDVGTQITTTGEMLRSHPVDVVRANLKRVQESLRTLEEFGKVISPVLGEELGTLRYEFYTLEKAILLTHASRHTLAERNLYLLVTEELCHHGSGPAVREALAAGVSIVQLREKNVPDRKIIEQGNRLRQWTRDAGALLIMNDRPDLAVLTEADGVHVGQEELSVRDARRIVGPRRLIGVSTHSIEQARQAVLDGADYIGVGPVFPSTTKQFDQFAGLEFVRQVAAEIALPWFAIGGINDKNLQAVSEAGALRVAVSSAICSAEHPGNATRQLAELLHRANTARQA